MRNDDYWLPLGKIELGDTTKIKSWLSTLKDNVWKLNQHPVRAVALTDLELNTVKEKEPLVLAGVHAQSMPDAGEPAIYSIRYGLNSAVPHWIFRGPGLIPLFDDWAGIHKQVTDLVGPCDFDYPSLIYSYSHVFKHRDRRLAALNVGLFNSEKSTNVYWEGREILAWHNTDDSMAYLLRVHDTDHSLIQDDSVGGMMWPRAVLTWDVSTLYQDIVKGFKEKGMTF